MRDLDQFRSTYFEECAELLTDLEEHFGAIAEGAAPAERINAAFRAVHSIKGGAGAFGFSRLVAFAHTYETLLSDLRDGQLALTKPVISLCIRANDLLGDHVTAARSGEELPEDYGSPETKQFAALARGEVPADAPDTLDLDLLPTLPGPMERPEPAFDLDAFATPPMAIERGTWEIRFTPHSELYARANDPLLLLRELESLGQTTVTALVGDLPPLGEFEPFGVYCAWEVTLIAPERSEADIREVFEFVEGICDLTVAELVSLPETAAAPVREAWSDKLPRFEEVAAELAMVTPLTLGPAPAAPAAVLEPTAPVAVPEPAAAEPPAPRVALTPEPVVEVEDRRAAVQSIRVDLEKVDRVVDMVSELVITQSMLAQQMDDTLRGRYHELVRGLEVLAQTTRGLQDSVMAIRAQPVRSVFARMPRLIRELSQQTGKPLRLETAGEATEIDKTVVEQLADPLVHMIRNAADHGIERPEQRRAAGKPETGTIRLSAEQAGSNIIISVEDDGAGINRARVLEVARQRGVAGPDSALSDEQIDSLIFAPGFSTAEAVSSLSGRGVGLDVVLSNIKKIGGSVLVRSTPGKGTRMTLRLPLTLAVLDVMQVTVAGSPYVVPLSSIIETLQGSRAEFSRAPSGTPMLRTRGAYVQVIDLAERFGFGQAESLASRFVVLCEVEGTTRVGLVVDDIVGQQQVVIKSLEQNFEQIPGIAGGTILGDGRVALILDVQGLRGTPDHRQAA